MGAVAFNLKAASEFWPSLSLKYQKRYFSGEFSDFLIA
jgi:hypothetical protein